MVINLEERMSMLARRVNDSMNSRIRRQTIIPASVPPSPPTVPTVDMTPKPNYREYTIPTKQFKTFYPEVIPPKPSIRHEQKIQRKIQREEKRAQHRQDWEINHFIKMVVRHESELKRGYLYVIAPTDYKRMSHNGRYPCKIGLAESPQRRIVSIQIGSWVELHYRWISPICLPHIEQVERDCHERFEGASLRGEWFMLGDRDIQQIEDYIKIVIYRSMLVEEFKTETTPSKKMNIIREYRSTEDRHFSLNSTQLQKMTCIQKDTPSFGGT